MGVFHGAARGALVDRIVDRFARLETPMLVHLSGPAGSGRSRLVEEVYERLAARQQQPYWPSLGIADRLPASARELTEGRRLELAPDELRDVAGLLPEHLWLALRGTTIRSPFLSRSDERGDLLDLLEAQLNAHLGPLLLNIESRFGAADAKRVTRLVLNFIPVLSNFAPLLETEELRDFAQRLAPSRRRGAALDAVAAHDVVRIDPVRDVDGEADAERLAKVVVTLAGELGFPTLIALDDAELADAGTVHLVRRVLQSSARVMVLAMTRTESHDGLSAPSPFDELVDDLAERRPARLQQSPLPELTREDIRGMVEERFPGAIGRPVEQVLDTAGDNPLVLQSLLVTSGVQRALLERRSIPDRLIASLPHSVSEAFSAIWNALEDEVREAFSFASLQGNPFDPGWLRGLPGEVASGLKRGEEAHGLVEYESVGKELLGWFRRSWVQLRARDALSGEYDEELVETAIDVYLRHVESRIAAGDLADAPPRIVRALLGAYVALGVGDGIIRGVHDTRALGRAALLLAGAQEQLARVDLALATLGRVARLGTEEALRATSEWCLLEARLERRTGRPTVALEVLERVAEVRPEDELDHLVEATCCRRDARLPIDVAATVGRIGAALARPEADGGPGPAARLSALRTVSDLIIDADAADALRTLEALAAEQEPLLDPLRVLALRSTLAGANARAGRFHRARELWLGIEADLATLDPSIARMPEFRGGYASWLPVVGEFRLGIAIMRETWEHDAQALSEQYPTVLTARQNLIYWLVEGGDMDAGDAAEEYATIADRLRVTMEPGHPILRNVRINRALMLAKSGRYEEALTEIAALRAESMDPTGAGGANVGRLDRYEALARSGLGDRAGALALSRRDHAARVEALGATAWRTQEALCLRARLEDADVALSLVDEALAGADDVADALNPAVLQLHGVRARIGGDVDGLRAVLERQETLLGATHEDVVRTRADLDALAAPGGA